MCSAKLETRTQAALFVSNSVDAEKEARAAAEKFGAASPEARTAWDIVEEIRTAEAGNPVLDPSLDELCDVEESELCVRYAKQLDELKRLIEKANGGGEDIIASLVAENAVLARKVSQMEEDN